MNDMVSMADYANFGNGFGITSPTDVENLAKALNTQNYVSAGGVGDKINGGALMVESLENSFKALTYDARDAILWNKIPKAPARSTVLQYNQLLSYGQPSGGFVREGELPQTQDSEYRRQATFVKFIGTTREITHVMTLVDTAPAEMIGVENQNGINWIIKQVEQALLWGNSRLAAKGAEGVQFDGLDALIPEDNTIDMAGKDLTEDDMNEGASLIVENYGRPTDIFLPIETMQRFIKSYFPKERVIMPTDGNGIRAGVLVNEFQTIGGGVKFNSDVFLRKTEPLKPTATGGVTAPTPPALLKVELSDTGTNDAEFSKSGAGTYAYSVTAANSHGESVPVAGSADIALTDADLATGVKLSIQNSATMVVEPEWFNIYRTEKDGTQKYRIMQVPAKDTAAGTWTVAYDRNKTMPNTCTAFMGELTPEVIVFRQLLPLMKMDLAQLGPVFRWMLLLYGAPILYMPRRWMKFKNIYASERQARNGLYYY